MLFQFLHMGPLQCSLYVPLTRCLRNSHSWWGIWQLGSCVVHISGNVWHFSLPAELIQGATLGPDFQILLCPDTSWHGRQLLTKSAGEVPQPVSSLHIWKLNLCLQHRLRNWQFGFGMDFVFSEVLVRLVGSQKKEI